METEAAFEEPCEERLQCSAVAQLEQRVHTLAMDLAARAVGQAVDGRGCGRGCEGGRRFERRLNAHDLRLSNDGRQHRDGVGEDGLGAGWSAEHGARRCGLEFELRRLIALPG